jgi:hypothetical protein
METRLISSESFTLGRLLIGTTNSIYEPPKDFFDYYARCIDCDRWSFVMHLYHGRCSSCDNKNQLSNAVSWFKKNVRKNIT